jgi:hypothetical protein
MSQINIYANPSGGGDVTIQSPPSTVSRLLTLPDEDGNLLGFAPFYASCSGTPGNGSTNTSVIRLSTVHISVGTGATLVQSATLGDHYLVNRAGMYQVRVQGAWAGGSANIGLTKNATGSDLTANVSSVAKPVRLGFFASPSANITGSLTWTGYCAVGDTIRMQSNVALVSSALEFDITRLA